MKIETTVNWQTETFNVPVNTFRLFDENGKEYAITVNENGLTINSKYDTNLIITPKTGNMITIKAEEI